jgi:hypothetical protein
VIAIVIANVIVIGGVVVSVGVAGVCLRMILLLE